MSLKDTKNNFCKIIIDKSINKNFKKTNKMKKMKLKTQTQQTHFQILNSPQIINGQSINKSK